MTSSKSFPWKEKITLSLSSQGLSWSNTYGTVQGSVEVPETTFTASYPLWVGCENKWGSVESFGQFRLYGLKIYENNNLVMNFVPVQRNTDGEVGMLDIISDTFYPDMNGGHFFAPEIFEDTYETVTAVQTSGNLYIDTGLVHTVNTKIVIDSIPSADTTITTIDSCLFGSDYNNAFGSDTWVLWHRSTVGVPAFRRGSDINKYCDLSAMDFTRRSVITAEGLDFTMEYLDGTSVTAHHDNGENTDGIYQVYRADDNPDIMGEHHCLATIEFQNGARNLPDSISGVLDTDLLEIVRDRLKSFQSGQFSCRENAVALTHVEEALMWMNRRVEERAERKVLGTDNK